MLHLASELKFASIDRVMGSISVLWLPPPASSAAAIFAVQPDVDPIGRDGYLLDNVPDKACHLDGWRGEPSLGKRESVAQTRLGALAAAIIAVACVVRLKTRRLGGQPCAKHAALAACKSCEIVAPQNCSKASPELRAPGGSFCVTQTSSICAEDRTCAETAKSPI